jgi:hypothetical protein
VSPFYYVLLDTVETTHSAGKPNMHGTNIKLPQMLFKCKQSLIVHSPDMNKTVGNVLLDLMNFSDIFIIST